MNEENIQARLESIDALPTLPLVLVQLQKLMRNPKSNMGQIASVVSKDQALTSKTIRLVNSAYYGLMSRISSIRQAIVILGLNAVNNLMIGLSVIRIFEKKGYIGFDHEAFWEHSFGTALIAKGIAVELHYKEPEDCFIGGLLHDLGRLVMEQYMHKDFIKAYTTSRKNRTSLLQEEQSIFGASHADVGVFLAKKWLLPDYLTAVIACHHSYPEVSESVSVHKGLIAIVVKANQLANKFGIGDSGENNVAPDTDFITQLPASIDYNGIVEMAQADVLLTIQEWMK